MRSLRLGTRGSALARWQANHVIDLLRQAHPDLMIEMVIVTTKGDKTLDVPLPQLGGKGVFTEELEAALRNGELDFAVHSLKDLPTTPPQGLTIGATPQRGSVQDIFVSREDFTLKTLPQGATIGTGSPRRAAQLLYHRPDMQMIDIRGNIDTRINKALDVNGTYTAIVVAQAGVERIGRMSVASQILPLEQMLPAPGQGALAVQCRDDAESLDLLKPINHLETQAAVTAERAFLSGLGGGCALPVAAYAHVENGKLHLRGRICSIDGRQRVDVSDISSAEISLITAEAFGHNLSLIALAQGGAQLMEGE
jgi:hydroxymethylbilane synthase